MGISTPAGECIAPLWKLLEAQLATMGIMCMSVVCVMEWVYGVEVTTMRFIGLVVCGVSPVSVLKSSTQLHPKTKPHHHRVIGLLMMRTVCLSTAWTAI